MKMYRGINGRTSGSGHELQVHRTSWTRSDVDRRPAGSCRTGSGCPWSPSWRPHPHLQEDEGLMLFYQIFSIQSVTTFSCFFLLYPGVSHQLWAGSNNIKNSLILVRILIESVLWQGSFRKTKVFMSHSTHQCIKRCALMITPSECHDSLALVGSNVSNR